MPSLNTPVFLLGTQRSGSTLLTRMLSMHSALFMQNEMGLLGIFDAPLAPGELYTRITSRLNEQHNIDVNKLQNEGVQWGWKEPLLTPHLDTVKANFPDSKYIVLVRDPRAVVASYIDNAWGLGTTAYTGALRWADEVAKQLAFADKYSDQCFIIKYEDLLAEPQQHLLKICDFLELPFEQAMVEYHKKPLEFEQNKSNVNTMKPLNTKGISKWKQVFDEAKIGEINTVCGDLMKRLAYTDMAELKTPVTGLRKQYYLAHQKIVGEIQLQYQLKVPDLLKKFKRAK